MNQWIEIFFGAIFVNALLVAYYYGMLNQKVKSLGLSVHTLSQGMIAIGNSMQQIKEDVAVINTKMTSRKERKNEST